MGNEVYGAPVRGRQERSPDVRYTGVRALGTGALAAVLATGPTGAAPLPADHGGTAPFYGQSIAWEPCRTQQELDALDPDAGGGNPLWLAPFECGEVTVPLDYADPGGDTFTLAVARRPAEDGDAQGSLVVNFGGPGLSAIDAAAHPFLSRQVREAFDLVLVDPRGVGRSGAVACTGEEALREAVADAARHDPEQIPAGVLRALGDASRDHLAGCLSRTGRDRLTAVGTVNTVRDLDIVRDALGDPRLTYLGYSYGTHIGSLYASMYPENTRAVVLDGVVDPGPGLGRSLAEQQVEGVARAWRGVVGHCVDTLPDCPFTSTGAAEEETRELLDLFEEQGHTVDGREITGDRLMELVAAHLALEQSWPQLAAFFTGIARGGTDEVFRTYLEYLAADPEPLDTPGHGAAFHAVTCADEPGPLRMEDLRRAAADAARDAPLFGTARVWSGAACVSWPRTETAPQGYSAAAAPPIVLIGARQDPATPYIWAERMHRRLTTSVLITYEGGGHTVYGYGRSVCVDEPVDDYLLTGEPPEPGTTCPSTLS